MATPHAVGLDELRGEDGAFQDGCPTRVVLDHVTSKWGVLVLAALVDGTHRWSELRRAVDGVSEKMLAATLRTLEQDGLVSRHSYAEVPPRVEYSLTDLGRGLTGAMSPLLVWVAAHAESIVG